MGWETILLRVARLGEYRNCLKMLEAYFDVALWWERLSLTGYLILCTSIMGKGAWRRAESILEEMLGVSQMSPREIAELLRHHVRMRLKGTSHLSFDKARTSIYDRPFYPIVLHLEFAMQPSSIRRLDFVKDIVGTMGDERANVADLGCGPGVILCAILAVKPMWVGHGLDISRSAVDYARRLSVHKGVAGRADFCIGDISHLPYKSRSLDLVLALEVVEHLPEPEIAIKEIKRVLRPGGKVIISIPLKSRALVHIYRVSRPKDLISLCERWGLKVLHLETRWHLGYGNDPKHVFALAEAEK